MSEYPTPQSLPVSVRRDESNGVAEIGVTVDGAFIAVAVYKLGHLDKLVQLAKDQAEQESQTSSE
jgi:hypothetical protein